MNTSNSGHVARPNSGSSSRAHHRRTRPQPPGRMTSRSASQATTLPYSFSEHGLTRLRERSSLSPQQVLDLLEDGAYEKLVRRIDKARLYQNPAWVGLSLNELRQRGVDTQEYCYKHVLIWSAPDQKALTLIIAVNDRHVVTVLDALGHDNGVDWSDRVTCEAIQRARAKLEITSIPSGFRVRVHARVTWLTPANELCGKHVPTPHLTLNDLPLSSSTLETLADAAMAMVPCGHTIRLQLVTKSKGSRLEAEYALERGANGSVCIERLAD